MLRFACVLLLLALSGALCGAADPVVSVPDLIAKVKDLRAKEAEAKKAREMAEAELRAEAKRLQDELDTLFGPGPKPPDPKPPEPPADALKAKIRAAFDSDVAQLDIKRKNALDLAELYRQASKLSADAEVATSGALLQRVRDAAMTLVGNEALREVRKVVGAELGLLLPTDDTLTDAQRKAVGGLFAKLAGVLEEMAK